MAYNLIGVSSKGRTEVFGTSYVGSNPTTPSKKAKETKNMKTTKAKEECKTPAEFIISRLEESPANRQTLEDTVQLSPNIINGALAGLLLERRIDFDFVNGQFTIKKL